VERRKLNLKAKFENSSSYLSYKRLLPGTFKVGLIGSTCTTLPREGPAAAPVPVPLVALPAAAEAWTAAAEGATTAAAVTPMV
jgi:hypothetical protein